MVLPNFLLIGSPKSGTTALYSAIRQHPEIYMSAVKEPHFFTFDGSIKRFPGPGGSHYFRRAVASMDEYLQLFAAAGDHSVVGEASVTYLRSAGAAARIKQTLPGSKLVAILRQPAERAYSGYSFTVALGIEPAPTFSAALEHEAAGLRDDWLWLLQHQREGFYYSQLMNYYKLFAREQLRVYLYEDWQNSPQALLQNLFSFLEVDEGFAPKVKNINVTLWPRNKRLNNVALKAEEIGRSLPAGLPARIYRAIDRRLQGLNRTHNLRLPPPLDPALRQRLTASYREEILRLQDLIGRDLSSWLA